MGGFFSFCLLNYMIKNECKEKKVRELYYNLETNLNKIQTVGILIFFTVLFVLQQNSIAALSNLYYIFLEL